MADDGDDSFEFSEDTRAHADFLPPALDSAADREEPLPERIDHFEIDRQIGAGTFGRVLLARDTLLMREVVLKIPRHNTFSSEATAKAFIDEARKAALLEHPGIVRIYHVGSSDFGPYIVQPYIAGGDLKQALKSRSFTSQETANLISQVAQAISCAHRHRIIHRDLKPANILLDPNGHPLVADFGLAMYESQSTQGRGWIAGTYQYMSPEQIRGESHRIDGRSDIWSLGVILYQMLVGRLPFSYPSFQELRDAICSEVPRPLRHIDASVPAELERICSRCLAIKMLNRYESAMDLSTELSDWLDSQKTMVSSPTGPVEPMVTVTAVSDPLSSVQAIVPKGLAAFGEEDREFFESLLPGPRTKDRVPEQIRYWISKIDCEPDKDTFSVGLIYGPSGCGKSSFVQAGLLPRLSGRVRRIFIEATDADTEVRLSLALRKLFPELPEDATLPQLLVAVREGEYINSDEKLLIVIDQFEQWLNAHDIVEQDALFAALRQCDGKRIQTLVLTRDDFWMRVSRFFQELEIPLVEQENFHALDLFDPSHAEKVLASFGRAYGKLSADGKLTSDQQRFLADAVKRLTVDGRIICIHLVLLAETLKAKAWEPDSLERGGRLEHIGLDFLKQQLSSTAANPNHRFFQIHIREILRSLLPSSGTDIKARFRPLRELAQAAGLPEQSKQFATVIDILDKQLRLISAVDPDGIQLAFDSDVISIASLASKPRYYQLTHDFLVPSVRAWLEDMDRLSPAGRTRVRLQSLAKSYSQTRDKRFLPTVLETLQMLRYVKWRDCNAAMQVVYETALKRFLMQLTVGCIVVACAVGIAYRARSQEMQRRADEWVRTWTSAQMSALPVALESTQLDKRLLIDALRRELSATSELIRAERLHLGLGLLGDRTSETCKTIVNAIRSAKLEDLVFIRQALQPNAKIALKEIADSQISTADETVRAKFAIVAFHLGDQQRLEDCLLVQQDRFTHLEAIHSIGRDNDRPDDYLTYLSDAKIELHDQLAGIANGLALQEWEKRPADVRQRYQKVLLKLYQGSPSGALHSAAQGALKRLGDSLAPAQTPPNGRWFELDIGLTFVEIPGDGKRVTLPLTTLGEDMKPVRLEVTGAHNYCLSTTEVSCRLFNQFASLPEFESRWDKKWKAGADEEPAIKVRPDQAMSFCNWLSKKYGRQPYYIETEMPAPDDVTDALKTADAKQAVSLLRMWKVDADADGFRVPSNFELFFAICGENARSLPEDLNRARTFALEQFWFNESAKDMSGRLNNCASRLPNMFGVFDMLGNAGELTIEPHGNAIPVRQSVLMVTSDSSLQRTMQPIVTEAALWYGSSMTGFRLACKYMPH